MKPIQSKFKAESREHLEAHGLRQKSNYAANWVAASQPYFKIAAAIGMAGLAVGSAGSFPALLAAGLGLGGMIGNKINKTIDPNQNRPETQVLLETLMDHSPIFARSLVWLVKDPGFDKRLASVRYGDVSKYGELPEALSRTLMFYRMTGSVLAGFATGQASTSDMNSLAEVFSGVSVDSHPALKIHAQILKGRDVLTQAQAMIENTPELKACAQWIESMKDASIFSTENIRDGMGGPNSQAWKFVTDVDRVFGGIEESLNLIDDANDEIQSGFTPGNTKGSYAAFFKNPKIQQFIRNLEGKIDVFRDERADFVCSVFGLKDRLDDVKQSRRPITSKTGTPKLS